MGVGEGLFAKFFFSCTTTFGKGIRQKEFLKIFLGRLFMHTERMKGNFKSTQIGDTFTYNQFSFKI